MPLINTAFQYNSAQKKLTEQKLASEDFTYKDWGNDDLEEIRISIRDFYRQNQNGVCAYCKCNISLTSPLNAHVEHIVPKSLFKKFMFEPKNLCILCADCNAIKKDQEVLNELSNPLKKDNILYPRSSKAFKIVHPHFDEYDDHIAIKGKIYIDITSKGNFTIGACKLNRYFQKFGINQDFIDDTILIEIMESFISSNSSSKRHHLLEELKNILLCST
ncbi:HNH endonuclease [Acinetobacter courvalinii]|uniref:HNH endonuclease n=1 Tax=Acinetobacter courvalinii TaxID=280147 RepID=UPI002896BC65|nr:HNH endonuclease [Acinetobacter courvalinii]